MARVYIEVYTCCPHRIWMYLVHSSEMLLQYDTMRYDATTHRIEYLNVNSKWTHIGFHRVRSPQVDVTLFVACVFLVVDSICTTLQFALYASPGGSGVGRLSLINNLFPICNTHACMHMDTSIADGITICTPATMPTRQVCNTPMGESVFAALLQQITPQLQDLDKIDFVWDLVVHIRSRLDQEGCAWPKLVPMVLDPDDTFENYDYYGVAVVRHATPHSHYNYTLRLPSGPVYGGEVFRIRARGNQPACLQVLYLDYSDLQKPQSESDLVEAVSLLWFTYTFNHHQHPNILEMVEKFAEDDLPEGLSSATLTSVSYVARWTDTSGGQHVALDYLPNRNLQENTFPNPGPLVAGVTTSQCAALLWHTYLNARMYMPIFAAMLPWTDVVCVSEYVWKLSVNPQERDQLDAHVMNYVNTCAPHRYVLIPISDGAHMWLAILTPRSDCSMQLRKRQRLETAQSVPPPPSQRQFTTIGSCTWWIHTTLSTAQ